MIPVAERIISQVVKDLVDEGIRIYFKRWYITLYLQVK